MRAFRPATLLAVFLLAHLASVEVTAAQAISYNEDIRPILSDNCFSCHGRDEKNRQGHRRLDTAEGAAEEHEGFRGIVAGSLSDSEVWQRITGSDEEERMPPADSHKPPLSAEQRELIKRWIEQGAEYQNHWSYEPLGPVAVPAASGGAGDSTIDRFIGEKLAARQLALANEAPREILLRRVTLDLTGLPPTAPEIDAFLADRNPGAYERVVERLLRSPHYGEHIARGWLDAVRYADTHGMHLDSERTLWPYRDWVVRAFNENKPFDRFTVEQLAGDLLPNPTLDQLIASGYNRANLSTSEGGAIAAEAEARNTSDRVDTTAAVWLGLTANCASCHDHKFDPLKQQEYYSLGAFFKGLADPVWDGNVRLPGPRVLLANAEQQPRLDVIARELPRLEHALHRRGDELLPVLPTLLKEPVTYEVIWAEDSDVPTVANLNQPPAAGEWRGGETVPMVGGVKALRLEGKIERVIGFATGELELRLRSALRGFAHFSADASNPPRAVSLQFQTAAESKRLVWGDPSAFGPDVAATAVVVGPLPLPGSYLRLEIDAAKAGLVPDQTYTGLVLAQSDGEGWWDQVGAVCTSPSAADDPLLSMDAWIRPLREGANDELAQRVPVPLDMKYLISLYVAQQTPAELKRRSDFYRDYLYAPLRGKLEPEANAARRYTAELVNFELTLPGSPISRELSEPKPAHVLLRGQYDHPGDRVEPATPAFLPPLTKAGPRASRLDLAQWMIDSRNPLVARVTVNRFWQQFFGAGLVRTPGDFGSQGDPPTHLALLNWLARDFIDQGWDVKRLVRAMVESKTYRQSSAVTPALIELDPANKLLARGPRGRLDAEVLRDQALAVSGLLRPELGGPPVRPYQPPNIWETVAYPDSNTRFYVQDHGAALYRRSLYTMIKRTAPAPAMTTFDGPSRESFCVGRVRSNSPLQALALMNDVQHFEAARMFAEKLMVMSGDDGKKLTEAFRAVTARRPTASEQDLLKEALATQRAHFKQQPAAATAVLANGESKPAHEFPPVEFAAWTLVANLLLNLDETITNH